MSQVRSVSQVSEPSTVVSVLVVGSMVNRRRCSYFSL